MGSRTSSRGEMAGIAGLRVGVIGLGAISEMCHLPALLRLGLRPALVVDTDMERAAAARRRFGADRISSDYRTAFEATDAAIVAVPHTLHGEIAGELLAQGIHVLVEKPLATTEEDCRALISRAGDRGAVLAVGLVRRFLPGPRWVKVAVQEQVIGDIRSFDLREGAPYSWPVRSDSIFRRATAGGGVLMDTGAHALDLLLWWLDGHDVTDVDYRDDAYGGVEAECELRFSVASGARGVVELSRTRELRNTAVLRGTKGEIEVSFTEERVETRPRSLSRRRLSGLKGAALPAQPVIDSFAMQIRDWLEAARSGGDPSVPGEEAMRSVSLIERCYRERQQLDLPWVVTDDSVKDSLVHRAPTSST